MASIRQLKNGAWEAQVRLKSNGKAVRQTRRFDSENEAQQWADALESLIKQAKTTGRILPTNVSLSDAFDVWQQDIKDWLETHPGNPGAARLTRQKKDNKTGANYWKASRWADQPLAAISQLDIENMIDDRRREGRSESTIANNLSILGRLYKHAQAGSRRDAPTGWRWTINNPIKDAKTDREVGQSEERDRRITSEEHTAIQSVFAQMAVVRELSIKSGKKLLKLKPTSSGPVISIRSSDRLRFIEAAYLAAIETAMRQEKLFLMTWRWIDSRDEMRWNIIIPKQHQGPSNKNTPLSIPVSPRLRAILKDLRGDLPRIGKALDEPVFGALEGDYAYRLLQKTCLALGIDDFNWHDLRHEACSRLAARGWTIAEIQRVSGHKTLSQLQRYIHITADEIHDRFERETQLEALESNSNQYAQSAMLNQRQSKDTLIKSSEPVRI